MLAFVSIVLRYFSNGAGERPGFTRERERCKRHRTDPTAGANNDRDELHKPVTLIQTPLRHTRQIFLITKHAPGAAGATAAKFGSTARTRAPAFIARRADRAGDAARRGHAGQRHDAEAVYYARRALLAGNARKSRCRSANGAQTNCALDLQSRTAERFSKAEITALQIVADLLASARVGRAGWNSSSNRVVHERLQRDAAANQHESTG